MFPSFKKRDPIVIDESQAITIGEQFSQVNLLCYGYIRRELANYNKQHINPNDIASILLRLLSTSDTITLRFKEKRFEWHNSCEARSKQALVIFNNDIINNLIENKHCNYKQTCIMSIRRKNHQCQNYGFCDNKNTYSIQCGVIAVPKQLNVEYVLTTNYKSNQLSHPFLTNLKINNYESALSSNNNNICDVNNDDDDNDDDDNIMSLDSDDDNNTNEENDNMGDNTNDNSFIDEINTFYLNIEHYGNKTFKSSFGINTIENKITLYDNSNNYNVISDKTLKNVQNVYGFENDRDIVNVCITIIKNDGKNGNSMMMSFYKDNEYSYRIGNIEHSLDCQNFKYFFALSSCICGCNRRYIGFNPNNVQKNINPKGFEYDIFLSRG